MRYRRAALTGLLLVLLPIAPAAADPVPYSDPSVAGAITLCDVRGQVATHGNIHTKPFVWRAVGGHAAPAPYNGAGRTAALYGYQPIKDVDPSQWNGALLTGGARYSSPDRPMAAATAADPSLADLLRDYPTRWDGLIELRMFLGVPGAATMTTPYNAATIKISGATWTLVDGGHDGCTSGTSVSSELALADVRKLGTPAPNATTDVPGAPGSGHSPPAGGATTAGARATADAGPPPASGGATAAAGPAGHSTGSSGASGGWWFAGLVVLAVGGGLVAWRLRRRPVTS